MVLDGTVETAIVDYGATSSCEKDITSECGGYKLQEPFIPTSKPFNKVFQYEGGYLGVGKEPITYHMMCVEEPKRLHDDRPT